MSSTGIAHNVVDMGIGQMLAKRTALTPNNEALTFEGATWTFKEFLDRVDSFAAVLAAGGIDRGDRVGFMGLNHPMFFVTFFGAARLGATFVPLNFRLTGKELAFIASDAGIHTMVADDLHMQVIDPVRGDVPCQRYLASETPIDGWEPMADLFGSTDALPSSDVVSPDGDDIAVIMYTSGTTGLPKGAMLTHANLCWNNINSLHAIDLGTDEIALVVAPLFHIGGLNVTTLVVWQKGGHIVLHRSFDPGAALDAIETHSITNMFGVPAMFAFMAQHAGFTTKDLSSLRLCVVGGAPVPEPLIHTYNDRNIPFAQGYGLTETAPLATFLLPDHALSKVGSAGFAPMYTDVECHDEDNRPVPVGERGEICIKGPNVMAGYWNRPDATAEAIDPEGWFHSGDIGYFDDDGFLYVVDRVKDMVISGGENVYPAEVESVLTGHPKIAEVAVIGMPDERWGEAVTAVAAVVDGQQLTLEELRDFASAELARFKLPSRLHTVDALPRNPAGKVLKYELRDTLAD